MDTQIWVLSGVSAGSGPVILQASTSDIFRTPSRHIIKHVEALIIILFKRPLKEVGCRSLPSLPLWEILPLWIWMSMQVDQPRPPTFFTFPGLRAVHIRMARQRNRLPADSYRIATCRLVVFCYITNKETIKSILSPFLIMPFSALRFHVFVCSVLAVHGRL